MMHPRPSCDFAIAPSRPLRIVQQRHDGAALVLVGAAIKIGNRCRFPHWSAFAAKSVFRHSFTHLAAFDGALQFWGCVPLDGGGAGNGSRADVKQAGGSANWHILAVLISA